MSTYKNISDDWYITLDGGVGTIYIDGNLDVTGNITYVSEIAVNDAFIIVAANNSPAVNVTGMGLIATKPDSPQEFAGLRFNSIADEWEISASVYANGAPITGYTAISTGTATPGGPTNAVQLNSGSGFTGSANLLFDKASYGLQANSQVTLSNIASTPSATANSASLYNKAQGVGGTGVYVVSSTANDELISLTRARLYAIIF